MFPSVSDVGPGSIMIVSRVYVYTCIYVFISKDRLNVLRIIDYLNGRNENLTFVNLEWGIWAFCFNKIKEGWSRRKASGRKGKSSYSSFLWDHDKCEHMIY